MRSFSLLVFAVLAVLSAASVFTPVATQNGVGGIIAREVTTNDGVTTPFPLTQFSAGSDLSPLAHLEGKSWSGEARWTGRTKGTGIYSGSYERVYEERYTYNITQVLAKSFTIVGSMTFDDTETASGSWVKMSSYVTCDGCTVRKSLTWSGGETVDRTTFIITGVSGNYASAGIGHIISEVVDPTGLAVGSQVSHWWDYDEDNVYRIVPYDVVREDTLAVGGTSTRVFVASHTASSTGWKVGQSYSKGQLTRTLDFDESTGVLLASHAEGTFSYQGSEGGWDETNSLDSRVTSVGFDLGDYVVIDSDLKTTVTVDGADLGTADQPKLLVWEWGSSHKITVPSMVDVSPGTRLVFTGWNDGSSDPTRTVVADKPSTFVAQFKRQHRLTLFSSYGNPVGSGWYDEGQSVNVHVESTYIFVLIFDSWSVDVQSDNPDVTVTMDGPKTLQANWRVDYARTAILVSIVALVAVVFFVSQRRRARLLGRTHSEKGTTMTYGPQPAPIAPAPHVVPSAPTQAPQPRAEPPAGKFCINCGSPLPSHAAFCRKCGSQQ
jgi:hypothetical protein